MHVSPYYLRFSVMDRPNVIAKIASVLGAFDIAIHQMIQEARAAGPRAPVQVVVLTHPTRDDALRAALREVQMLSGITETPRAIRIETAT
jgi:homoserine dehydrogenase